MPYHASALTKSLLPLVVHPPGSRIRENVLITIISSTCAFSDSTSMLFLLAQLVCYLS